MGNLTIISAGARGHVRERVDRRTSGAGNRGHRAGVAHDRGYRRG